jgi:predicted glycosyltransferase
MFYSHDSYGLGHLRRTLTLARFLRARRPLLSQLIVTGSPLAHRFQFPPGADYIKLPSVVKVGAERYESRFLPMSFGAIRELRREMLLSAARHFQPRTLVVDNVPTGLKGELVSTLRYLKTASCRLILGLRDVVDEAEWVRHAWANNGSFELLDDVYDQIVVYGRQEVYDVVDEYGFSSLAAEKTRFVGYLLREGGARMPEEIRADLGVEDRPLVLVMAGGGGDGRQLLGAVLEAIALKSDGPDFSCLLVGGPLMPPSDRRRVLELVAERPFVRYIDFVEDAGSYIAAADVVVSMGGYNSVSEVLAAQKSAIIVPRISPRREQLIRAEALSRRELLRMIHPDELRPKRLLAEMEHLLELPEQLRRRPMPRRLAAAPADLDVLLVEPRPASVAAIGG